MIKHDIKSGITHINNICPFSNSWTTSLYKCFMGCIKFVKKSAQNKFIITFNCRHADQIGFLLSSVRALMSDDFYRFIES